MWPVLLLLACAPATPAPDPASPSAKLATRVGAIGRQAATLDVELQNLEGEFDAIKTAPPEERERLAADLRARATAAREQAVKLRDAVSDVEAGAEVY